jgi:hypothetical protein
MEVLTTLNQVRRFLDNFEYINYGGCGIAALSMYRWLKKNNMLKGNECFIFLYQANDFYYNTNERFFKGLSKNIVSCTHVVLKIDDEYYDTTGKTRTMFLWRYLSQHDNIPEDNLIIALNNDCWNYLFDRKLYVPIIEKVLGIDLSDIIIDVKELNNDFFK